MFIVVKSSLVPECFFSYLLLII